MDETIRRASTARGVAVAMSLAAAIFAAAAAGAQPAPPATAVAPPMPGAGAEAGTAVELPAVEEPIPALPGPVLADAVPEAEAPGPRADAPPATPAAEVATLPRDLSPWGMFAAADVVVKSVMIGLAVASLLTWTVCFAKSLEILLAGLRLRRSLGAILRADDLAAAEGALAGRGGPAALMVRAARAEAGASTEALRHGGGPGLLQRVASHLSRIEAQAGRRLNVGTGVLATIGATAPFVGLFGTVWGIMNSFIGISEAQTTNLAVVAPGIAEALLATALGLVAAIPAVVIYNVFARWTAGYRARLADAAAAVERLVSRDLDHRRLAEGAFRQAAE